ncbi:MAG: hypothetical protein EA412_01790 [Chitinophagaceae bacterium]|nr:MAG: hypothetical protein EA412_01790 [Chitinophagaceae bacterium]
MKSLNSIKMLITLRYLLFTSLFVTIFIPLKSEASHHLDLSNATVLEGFIDENRSLTSGQKYLIQHNVRVSSEATLTIPENVTLIFSPNTTLVVEGGLNINGTANNFVHLLSKDEVFRGDGIVVRGNRGSAINIRYAKFTELEKPLLLESNWFRKTVKVENTVFQDIQSGQSSILIQMPSTVGTGDFNQKAEVTFNRNNFVNNWGSIYIEDFQSDHLELNFTENLITNNVVYGVDKGIPSNTPVFGLFDNEDKAYLASIKRNSIFNNYQINASTDSIIREISFGIQGNGESFNVSENFFRSKDKNYIYSTFDHFYHNNNLPLLIAEPILEKPSPNVHGHIYRVDWDGVEINDYTKLPEVSGLNVNFDVYFNRPVTSIDDYQMDFLYFDTINNEVNVQNIDIDTARWSENNTKLSFRVSEPNFLRNKLGYIVFYNFVDEEGFEVPEFPIGQLQAVNRYSRLYREGFVPQFASTGDVVSQRSSFEPSAASLRTLESLSEVGDLSYLGSYVSLARTFEVGLFLGLSNYAGELTRANIDQDEFNLAFGIFGKYNISRWFSASLGFRYGMLSGTDFNELDPNRVRRAVHFRSPIYEISANIEWYLMQYGVNRGERFAPSLFAGIAAYQFNPQARAYLGLNDELGEHVFTDEWYDLHPIGTEGQNVPGAGRDHYSLRQISVPFGVNLNFIIQKSFVLTAELGFRFTFTDYLDDIGGFFYLDEDGTFDAIKANAPDYGQVTDVYGVTHDVVDILIDPSMVRNPNKPYHKNFLNNKRGDANRDWYFFTGLKVSKVLGLNRKLERQERERFGVENEF